jgi:tetratricopeptide (TPR) repeat protein
MNAHGIQDLEKVRKDRAKKAVALAMHSRWAEAAAMNEAILADFPRDLEAYNRLGKALSELGRNRDAKEAFQRALEVSPNNGIAKKNLDRLARLGDDFPKGSEASSVTPDLFIEERGKAGVTSLVNLASSEVLSKLAPGHPVKLEPAQKGLLVADRSGTQVGQVEPRLASRLTRLIKGGNEYSAAVTSVGADELTIIIREERKHPSQARIVSFPLKGADYRVYVPKTLLGYELAEDEATRDDAGRKSVKDWSDDDTEPGNDDDYSPTFHRIINTAGESSEEDSDI